MITKIFFLKMLGLVFSLMSLASLGALPASSVDTNLAAVRYVATTGSDTGNCTLSSSPCRTIQYAINQSSSDDTILVAQGTYVYTPSLDPCPTWALAVICFADKNLTIIGGYSTNNWGTANPSGNLTILDGQNTYRGGVVIGYTAAHLNMQGFTIQNGRAQGPSYGSTDPAGRGGGLWVVLATVTLQDMVFKDNLVVGLDTASGDGGRAFGGALEIENSPTGSTSLLQRVVFDHNQAFGGAGTDRGGVAFGGALFAFVATVVVEDSTFTNNLAQGGNSSGSGISQTDGLHADALGGGVSVENGAITLRRVVLTGNQAIGGNAGGTGGGAYGAGVFVEGVSPVVSSLTLADAYLANNIATGGNALKGGNSGGGGVLTTNSSTNIERAQIIANTSIGGSTSGGGDAGPGAGGGIYLFSIVSGIPAATLQNVIVADNFAAHGAGNGSSGTGAGGGIVVQGMDVEISHATLANNRLDPSEPGLILGQALVTGPWPLPGGGSLPAVVELNHSIVANHTVGGEQATAVAVQVGSTLTFNYGLFSGNDDDTNAGNDPVPAGTINGLDTMQSASSPGFISPGPPYQNYHLRLDSAAKDEAASSSMPLDFEGQTRPFDGAADLGGDEYHPFPLAVTPGDGTLRLDWTLGAENMLTGGVNNYQVYVACSAGAQPPDQGGCGSTINVGSTTNFTLTGLSNFKDYTLTVYARDGAQFQIARSLEVTAFPTDLLVYLPIVIR